MRRNLRNLFGLTTLLASLGGSLDSAALGELPKISIPTYSGKWRRHPANHNSNNKAKAKARNRASDKARTNQRRYK